MNNLEDPILEEASMDTETPEQGRNASSPYPALQAVLPRLAALNPNHKQRPVFDERGKAELYIDVQAEDGEDLTLIPVWAINHTDLQSSTISGWSVTEYPC